MTTSGRKRSGGFALVAVLMLMLLLLGMGAAMHSGIMSDTVQTGAHRVATEGFYAAEAGVNRGMGDYRNIFLSQNVPTAADFAPHSFNLGPRLVSYSMSPVPGYQNGVTIIVPGGRTFAGLNATEYRYTTNARSELHTGDTEVQLGTEFNVDYIPLFQFLAFYQGDLEMLPGPNMTLHGPIHTNGNLYLNAGNTIVDHRLLSGDVPDGDSNRARRGSARHLPRPEGRSDGAVHRHGAHLEARRREPRRAPRHARHAVQRRGHGDADDGAARQLDRCRHRARASGGGAEPGRLHLRRRQELVPRRPAHRPRPAEPRTRTGVSRSTPRRRTVRVDTTQTARLQTFMTAKPGRLFYNDIPVANRDQLLACNQGNSYCNQANYAPVFPSAARVYACAGSDNNTPPLAGCANGYVTNDIMVGGTMPGSVTARRGGFYNNREHAWIYMLNLNAHDLLAWNIAQGAGNRLFDPLDDSDGGLVIFLSVVGPGQAGIPAGNPARRYGVRVFGSDHLDFPANPGNPDRADDHLRRGHLRRGQLQRRCRGLPENAGVLHGRHDQRALGGVVGHREQQERLPEPPVARRCVAERGHERRRSIAAYIGGVDVTTVGNYNGGFENYPRFHENWTATYSYRGSYVNLGTPRHNNGAWCGTGGTSASGCNMYNPPTRNWDFDTDFTNAANLPPLTPNAVGVEQILFTESFR